MPIFHLWQPVRRQSHRIRAFLKPEFSMGLSPPFCSFYFRAQTPLVWIFWSTSSAKLLSAPFSLRTFRFHDVRTDGISWCSVRSHTALYKSLEMYRVHGKSVRGTFQAIYTKSGDMVHISLLVGLLALSGCAVCMVIIAAYKNGRKRNS